MNNTLNVIGMLLVATVIFHGTMNFMVENIEDFETVPLPPKKSRVISSDFPLFKVDATSKKHWTLVDFSTGKTYQVSDLEKESQKLKSLPWDLAFQRTKIITNGGATNENGPVQVANMGEVDFKTVLHVPQSGFIRDSRSFGKVINKNISDWYLYRTRTHNIESKKNVYVIQDYEGKYFKLRILNYYCEREEKDCKTVMCGRDEAACITIEYLFSQNGTDFPAPPPTEVASTPLPELR